VVVTNAHVVAGQNDTTVETLDGAQLGATAVHYEPRNDLAVLRVDGLGAPALGIVPEPPSGTAAAVLGYPENGPYTVVPARLGETSTVLSETSYGRGPVEREMTPFRGRVRSGNSGGPVVDDAGMVLTTVFASTTGGGTPSGLGVPNSVVSRALERARGPVSTGACAA
jgi:S1-C subfamily serine protease